jgi:hypothetical protein
MAMIAALLINLLTWLPDFAKTVFAAVRTLSRKCLSNSMSLFLPSL